MGIPLAKAYVIARGDTSQLKGDLTKGRAVVENQFGGMANVITAKMTQAFGAIAAGMGMLKGIQMVGALEQNIIAFETMMGSAEKAKSLLADLSDFAAKTPFRMAGIVQAARGLVMFGEKQDQVMGTLRMLGNAAAGTSSDFGMLALIFNQVRGVGKLLTQDFRQLSTRGVISLVDIAKHFDVTTEAAQKMLSTGRISFEDLRAILRDLSEEGGRFHNLMEKQSKSLLGLWSTMQEELEFFARDAMTPLVQSLKDLQTVVIKAASALRGMMNPRFVKVFLQFAVALGLIKLAILAWYGVNKLLASSLIVIHALAGPAGWLKLAAGIAIATGLVVAMNIEFEKAEKEAGEVEKAAKKASDSVQVLGDKKDEILELTKSFESLGKAVGGVETIGAKLLLLGASNLVRDLEAARTKLKALQDDMAEHLRMGHEDTEIMRILSSESLEAAKYIGELRNLESGLKALENVFGSVAQAAKFLNKVILETEDPAREIERITGKLKSLVSQRRITADQMKDFLMKTTAMGDPARAIEKVKNETRLLAMEAMGVNREFAQLLVMPHVTLKGMKEMRKELERREAIQKKMEGKRAGESLFKDLMTPVETARKELERIAKLFGEGFIKPETARRALKRLAEGLKGPELAFAVTGEIGFAEFGKRIQDALLKTDDPAKRTAKATEASKVLLGKIEIQMDNLKPPPAQFGP